MAKSINTVLAKNLKRLMRQNGYSQSELARRLQLKPQTVQKWTAAKSVPRSHTLVKLAKILKTEPGDLISGPPRNGKITSAGQSGTDSVDRLLSNPLVVDLPDYKLINLINKMSKVPDCIRQLAKRLEATLGEIANLRKQLNQN